MNTTMRYEHSYRNSYTNRSRCAHNRRRQTSYKNKRVLFVAITVVVILLGIVLGNNIINASHSSAYSEVEKELCYTSVEIEEGDTLWSIAEEYMCSEYDDVNDYIKDIKQINNLHSDTIHAGGYLMVPYYEIIK
ncbi:MAG: LysM peptidoglycan-binding domain-containing protein [Agathobacter sp.]